MTENKKKTAEKKEPAERPSMGMPDNTPKQDSKQEEAKKDEKAELIDLLQRTQANYENYRKQVEKRMEEVKDIAGKDVILQILPVMDNFELALKNCRSHIHGKEFKEFLKGIQFIYSQLLAVLEKNGIQAINTEKMMFNPYEHEALMKVESEFPENTVLEEFQKGFILNGKVIRHAKVKLSSGCKEVQNNLNHDNNNQDNNKQNII